MRTRWTIQTLGGIREEGARRLAGVGSDRMSEEMTFDVEISGPRTIDMVCTCSEALPDPLRLGAASVAWRRIDETVERIWMIGDEPRFRYPEFMRQRRQLVERLSRPHRQWWTYLALVRAAPVLGAWVGDVAAAEATLTALTDIGMGDLAPFHSFAGLTEGIRTEPSGRASEELGMPDLGHLWVQAWQSAVNGSRFDSVDLMSYASERISDILFVLEASVGPVSVGGLAAAEDIAWFRDAVQLADDEGARVPVLARCRTEFDKVLDFCARPDVRSALRKASLAGS
ncbi:hypothetical protein G9272_16215 [Streptomyces asoensis]|uniref:Uncharacterized protein n=1 Tax=Streptomyces asoensis TaxID=249586 RepID=A0A6M4WMP0_9ACTN|nr:hypothetical protein [Streptomyces asoensis]QJT01664.1 hypothetical protein G9272_16215 [Streptomyces asoensis]